ncbi:MAG TPA: S41 family peptidase [Clostridiales bacterium]|nr:S41 family peptidase [Clostridiales bacterium]
MYKKSSVIIGIIVIVLVTSIITFSIAAVVFLGPVFNNKYQISFDTGSVNYESIKKFNQARKALKDNYYEDVDENVLLEGAVAGMAASLDDPYTVYYTKEQMDKILEIPKKSEETYVGIGVSIIADKDGIVTVVEPFTGTPAYEAGIKQGDKIIKVNDEDVTALKDESTVVKLIKGPENTTVKITVYRPSEGRPIDFEVSRKKITVQLNIRSEVLQDNIGYIRLISFMDDKINKEFEEHLKKLLDQNIKALVIDVRDNPGGYYNKVVNIVDRIIPEGLIVYTEDRQKNVQEERSDKRELEIPLAVLINENSASASEILAGAIKDHKKGALVGTKTFGKGLVQNLLPLDDGSGIKITISRYFTPSGVCIHGTGIEPDINIDLDEKYKYTPISQIPREDDIQLKKAVEILNRLAS